MTTNEMDQAVSEAFAERMLGVINHGALALMVSIGHRTGLFDVMSGLPPPRAKG
jgi:winged helix-turn-helix protein